MTDSPDPTDAEEWARWAAVHDDWPKTRELMGVLLKKYDQRGERIAQLERSRDRYRTALAEAMRRLSAALDDDKDGS